MITQLDSKKLDLIQWISTVDDDDVLNKLQEIRENEQSGWWTKISQNERDSIEKGIEDAENGNLKSDSEARKIYEKWL